MSGRSAAWVWRSEAVLPQMTSDCEVEARAICGAAALPAKASARARPRPASARGKAWMRSDMRLLKVTMGSFLVFGTVRRR